MANGRNQHQAYKIAAKAYPFKCCTICGLQLDAAIELAHLDNDPANNRATNLAWLCATHHRMYDRGLYPPKIVKALRKNWQETKGKGNPSIYMKDAGEKAARTKGEEGLKAAGEKAATTRKRRNAGQKAVETKGPEGLKAAGKAAARTRKKRETARKNKQVSS